jgi:hypothetical protein
MMNFSSGLVCETGKHNINEKLMLLQLRNSGETFTASSPHMMDLMQQIRLNMIIIIILFGDTIDQLPCPVGSEHSTLFRLEISPKSSMFIRMLQMSRYMG